jgi:superfamily I DNA/RNA helicase
MANEHTVRVSFDAMCLRSLQAMPARVQTRFLEMVSKVMADPSRHGLNIEPIQGARDDRMKSLRLDQAYRAIAWRDGGELLFLHVDEHDKAYRWASARRLRLDPATNRIRMLTVEETQLAPESARPAAAATAPKATLQPLFGALTDDQLLVAGVQAEELAMVRRIGGEEDLAAARDNLDATTHDVLTALAAGYQPDEILDILGLTPQPVGDLSPDFSAVLNAEQNRSLIFVPGTEDELRRFFEGDLSGWRVFLHPEQRRLAYRSYAGPVLVRGGAGTGKTVVAMHRARHLADLIAQSPARAGQRVLFTTFTANLARDIAQNLKSLCPEHFDRDAPRIEVTNLDAWVGNYLRQKNFGRRVAYLADDRQEVDALLDEACARGGIPDGLSLAFVRAEWASIVLAQGVTSRDEYFQASRAGRGTPLDRRKRAALWPIFESFRAALLDAGRIEPDDAFREARMLIDAETRPTPYMAVIVDETQDMGEQALRLIRALAPSGPDAGDSLFVVGDAHQRIYDRRASLSTCGIDVRGRSRKLRLNYRTTEDIRRWAARVLDGLPIDDLDAGTDETAYYSSLVRGPAPLVEAAASRDTEYARLADWARGLIDQGTPASAVAILARTKKRLQEARDVLNRRGVETLTLGPRQDDDPSKPGIRLATMHRAKGLEFDAVALIGMDADEMPPRTVIEGALDAAARREAIARERALIHVAATRARSVLRVSYAGDRTSLLG